MKKYSSKEIKKKYDSFARWYDWTVLIFELFFARHRKELLHKAQGKVLEVGAGTGRNLKYYGSRVKLTLIDLSEEMLQRAKKRAEKRDVNAHFVIGSAEKLPFKTREFDTVIDTLGLCTYPHPMKALREMKRVCKKNGRILLLEHGISNKKNVRLRQEKTEAKHYQRAGCTLLRDHHELVEKAGLRIIKEKRALFGILYIIQAKP